MVNLLITMRCTRSCSYCFAKEKLHSYSRSKNPLDIEISDLDRVIDFLVRSGCDALQVAGGEPTLHPRFDEILIRILRGGITVNLLSNALWNSEKNAFFSRISPTKLGFLLNIDHPDAYRPSEWETIQENLRILKGRENVTLSFNIFQRKPRFEYVFDLAERYGFRNLRLSFSMPVVFGEVRNLYLAIEDYKTLAPFISDFVKRAENLGASVKMDNTVPLCMFSKAQLGELLLREVIDPRRNFVCFPAVDIGPDLSIWRCFGTSGLYNKKLEEFNSLSEIYEYYERAFKPYQFKVYPMDECNECKHARESVCQGGCIGLSIAKCIESNNWPRETTYDDILEMKPKLLQDVTVRKYEVPEETLTLSLQNANIMVEIRPQMKSLLDLFDGNRTIQEAMEIYIQKNTLLSGMREPLDAFLKSTVNQEAISMIRRLLDRGILVLQENKE